MCVYIYIYISNVKIYEKHDRAVRTKPIKKLLIVQKKIKKIWTYGTFEDHTEM